MVRHGLVNLWLLGLGGILVERLDWIVQFSGCGMSLETLEFVIYPDGRVQETVTGIVGASCEEVTRKIEEQLGRVVHRESTSDRYASETIAAQDAIVSSLSQTAASPGATYSDWA